MVKNSKKKKKKNQEELMDYVYDTSQVGKEGNKPVK